MKWYKINDTNYFLTRSGKFTIAANYVGQKTTANIAACCNGRIKSSMGYKWAHL